LKSASSKFIESKESAFSQKYDTTFLRMVPS